MTRKYKYYTQEFKLEAIRLLNESDKPVIQCGVDRSATFFSDDYLFISLVSIKRDRIGMHVYVLMTDYVYLRMAH